MEEKQDNCTNIKILTLFSILAGRKDAIIICIGRFDYSGMVFLVK